MSAETADEVVYKKSRHPSGAASTVSGSSGSGGSAVHSTSRMVSHTFVVSRVELKRWSNWKNIRGTGITMGEAQTTRVHD